MKYIIIPLAKLIITVPVFLYYYIVIVLYFLWHFNIFTDDFFEYKDREKGLMEYDEHGNYLRYVNIGTIYPTFIHYIWNISGKPYKEKG